MENLIYKNLQVFSFKTTGELHEWFLKNYSRIEAFWLRYFKKATQKPTINHEQGVEEALCWGWIDGLTNAYDEESWVIRFTPRRAKSVWSKINVAKVERLIKEKRMQPSGQMHVDAAKADGRWDAAYAGQSTITVPKKFITLLKTSLEVWKFYQSLNKTNKYAIAYRLATVKKEKENAKMQQLFTMLQDNKTFH